MTATPGVLCPHLTSIVVCFNEVFNCYVIIRIRRSRIVDKLNGRSARLFAGRFTRLFAGGFARLLAHRLGRRRRRCIGRSGNGVRRNGIRRSQPKIKANLILAKLPRNLINTCRDYRQIIACFSSVVVTIVSKAERSGLLAVIALFHSINRLIEMEICIRNSDGFNLSD